MSVYDKLEQLSIQLPQAGAPAGHADLDQKVDRRGNVGRVQLPGEAGVTGQP